MREKSLSVHGDCGDFRAVLDMRNGSLCASIRFEAAKKKCKRNRRTLVVFEYAKSILACMENTLKECKQIRRIQQKPFALCGDYKDRHEIEPDSV